MSSFPAKSQAGRSVHVCVLRQASTRQAMTQGATAASWFWEAPAVAGGGSAGESCAGYSDRAETSAGARAAPAGALRRSRHAGRAAKRDRFAKVVPVRAALRAGRIRLRAHLPDPLGRLPPPSRAPFTAVGRPDGAALGRKPGGAPVAKAGDRPCTKCESSTLGLAMAVGAAAHKGRPAAAPAPPPFPAISLRSAQGSGTPADRPSAAATGQPL